MLIDQQQKPNETLQDYVQRFPDLLLKSSGLILYQGIPTSHNAFYMQFLQSKTTALCVR